MEILMLHQQGQEMWRRSHNMQRILISLNVSAVSPKSKPTNSQTARIIRLFSEMKTIWHGHSEHDKRGCH